MNEGLSIVALISNASLPVIIVMLILLAASVTSWYFIFQKWRVLSRARSEAAAFEEQFWSGADLSSIFREIDESNEPVEGVEAIFESGFREFVRQRQRKGKSPVATMEATERAMRVAMNKEVDKLELHLSFLATVGSTSPYVGLFGTVWGIMISFQALAQVSQATISMVAPGISEALIATAMGLFAAIPAVVGYNRFSYLVERLEVRFDTFREEFSSILHRQVDLEG